MLNFPYRKEKETVANNKDIPKEMDLFFKSLKDYIPKGKKWEDLTKEEQKKIKDEYRFGAYRPGIYQTITGNEKTR